MSINCEISKIVETLELLQILLELGGVGFWVFVKIERYLIGMNLYRLHQNSEFELINVYEET